MSAMDKQAELIETLQQLSHWSRKTAELLTAVEITKQDSPLVIGIPPCQLSVFTGSYEEWPLVHNHKPSFPHDVKDDGRYLVVQAGAATLPTIRTRGIVDVVTSCNQPNLPHNTKIIHLNEARGPYNFCIFNQSLEFFADPVSVLRHVKELLASYGKIIVRFRPWTAPDGGYYPEKAISNKAYLHLASQSALADDVEFKVTRPLSTYDAIIGKCRLQVVSRIVHHSEVDGFFAAHPDILQIIKSRTWTYASDEEAIRIMSVASVDYVLQS